MPKVSILIPVYNNAPYLNDAVGSMLSQTFADFELIAVNDGSTDGSGEILQSLAERDRRVRVLQLTRNLGIVGALNAGLEQCGGEYVARMDGDDISHPERLRLQLRFLDAHPDHVACGSDMWMFGARHWYVRYPRTDCECKSLLTLFPCFSHSSIVLRRRFLEPAPYREEYCLAEDYRLWVDLLHKGKFANLPRPLVHYRVHPGQSIAMASEKQRHVHSRISAERLACRGLGRFGTADVHRFLWPWGELSTDDCAAYFRHIRRFVPALWHLNPSSSRWLRTAMMRVAVKNLLLRR